MSDVTDSFTRLGPADPLTPVVIAVPHAGRDYPARLMENSALSRARLESLEDRFADLLIDDAVAAGATAFVASRARAWIDLNRDEREIDAAMVEAFPPGFPIAPTARVRGGLGLIPRRIGGQDIHQRRLTVAEVRARIEGDHRPWHDAVGAALERARACFGVALLIDCHSMPPIRLAANVPPPQVVIGDRHGRSASGAIVGRAQKFATQAGFRAALNNPYAGGYALDRHGRPEKAVHAIQIEIDRGLYLDSDLRTPGAALPRIRRFIADLTAALIGEALPEPPALAAE